MKHCQLKKSLVPILQCDEGCIQSICTPPPLLSLASSDKTWPWKATNQFFSSSSSSATGWCFRNFLIGGGGSTWGSTRGPPQEVNREIILCIIYCQSTVSWLLAVFPSSLLWPGPRHELNYEPTAWSSVNLTGPGSTSSRTCTIDWSTWSGEHHNEYSCRLKSWHLLTGKSIMIITKNR
jgi:hypothetical protein